MKRNKGEPIKNEFVPGADSFSNALALYKIEQRQAAVPAQKRGRPTRPKARKGI